MIPSFQSYILTVQNREHLYTCPVYSDFTLDVLLSKILNLRFYGVELGGFESIVRGAEMSVRAAIERDRVPAS